MPWAGCWSLPIRLFSGEVKLRGGNGRWKKPAHQRLQPQSYRGLQALSQVVGRVLNRAEAIEMLFAQLLAGHPLDEDLQHEQRGGPWPRPARRRVRIWRNVPCGTRALIRRLSTPLRLKLASCSAATVTSTCKLITRGDALPYPGELGLGQRSPWRGDAYGEYSERRGNN